jgi:hypothetical protein
MKLNSMKDLPTHAKGKHFSAPVLLFSADDNTFCELGYYDFKTQKWLHFGGDSVVLVAWSYLPPPEEFLAKIKDMTAIQ